jgi:hypothetical protein
MVFGLPFFFFWYVLWVFMSLHRHSNPVPLGVRR